LIIVFAAAYITNMPHVQIFKRRPVSLS